MIADMSSRAWLGAFSGSFLLLTACGGDDDASGGAADSGPPPVDTTICSVNSKCSNEPAESDADKKACKSALEGRCASQYRMLDTCQKTNEVCDANGKADINASAMKCKADLDAYVSCQTGKAPADAGTD